MCMQTRFGVCRVGYLNKGTATKMLHRVTSYCMLDWVGAMLSRVLAEVQGHAEVKRYQRNTERLSALVTLNERGKTL